MIVYWLLLLPTAVIAYGLGSMDSIVLASNFVFRRNLRRLGTGDRWLSNFRRIYGIPGFLRLMLVEVVRDLLPILIGGLLLSIKGHGDVGRAFAGFCLVLGRLYPLFYNFKGGHASICLIVAAFAVDVSAGAAVLVVVAGLTIFSRYFSLGAAAGAVVYLAVAVLLIDNSLVMRLCIFTAVLVIIKHIPALRRILKGEEYRFSTEEDLSYKLDEKF